APGGRSAPAGGARPRGRPRVILITSRRNSATDRQRLGKHRLRDPGRRAYSRRSRGEASMSRKGLLIATAAAGLILAGAGGARAAEDKAGDELVHCAGVNACKGKGICAGPDSECAGVNACKGKGVIATTAEECKQKGGKIVDKQM